MLVMYSKPDLLLPIQFAKVLGNQPALVLSGSIPGLPSVKTAGTPMSETMQSETNEGYAGTGEHVEHIICGGLDAGIDEV